MIKRLSAVLTVLTAVALSGCGFKSDLSLPDSDTDELFKPDAPPAVRVEDLPAISDVVAGSNSSSDGEGVVVSTDAILAEDIMLDKVTSEAVDGLILVNPDDATDDGAITDESSTDGSDGVVVDFSDLTDELESNR